MLENPSIRAAEPDQGRDRAERGLAIVTGGRRGIGRAICRELAASGFDIAILDAVEDSSSMATLELVRSSGGKVAFYRRDISQTDDNAELIARIEAELGAVTCLVNNAGIQVSVRGDLLEVTEQTFDRLLDVNLRGTFFFTQAVAKAMLATVDETRHRTIITITSANAGLVSPEKGPYCISKAGLSMASQQFALRLADAGIFVHEVRPGLIQTDMTADVFEKYSDQVAAGTLSAIRRWGQPEDIARGVASLAVGAIPFATGDIYHIGGGMQIHRL